MMTTTDLTITLVTLEAVDMRLQQHTVCSSLRPCSTCLSLLNSTMTTRSDYTEYSWRENLTKFDVSVKVFCAEVEGGNNDDTTGFLCAIESLYRCM